MAIGAVSDVDLSNFSPCVKVIGVGGAGGNAVFNMISSGLEGVEFIVANTDAQSLNLSICQHRIQLGRTLTAGLGAGAMPETGRKAAQESKEEIMQCIQGAHMIFIAAGMGGGTGTGAAPVIAQMARELGILTVAVVTKPFNFEGNERMRAAENGIAELEKYVDTLIVASNQNLFRIATESTSFADAFKMADDVLFNGVKCVTDLFIMPGLINLDFADVRTIMANRGRAMMGSGEASGVNRAQEAADSAVTNPLLDDVSIAMADGLLINITGGPDMTLFEVNDVVNSICSKINEGTKLIFGAIFNEQMEGRIRVSVVATGVGLNKSDAVKPIIAPQKPTLISEQNISQPQHQKSQRAWQQEMINMRRGAPNTPVQPQETVAMPQPAKINIPQYQQNAEEEDIMINYAAANMATKHEFNRDAQKNDAEDEMLNEDDFFLPNQPSRPSAAMLQERITQRFSATTPDITTEAEDNTKTNVAKMQVFSESQHANTQDTLHEQRNNAMQNNKERMQDEVINTMQQHAKQEDLSPHHHIQHEEEQNEEESDGRYIVDDERGGFFSRVASAFKSKQNNQTASVATKKKLNNTNQLEIEEDNIISIMEEKINKKHLSSHVAQKVAVGSDVKVTISSISRPQHNFLFNDDI